MARSSPLSRSRRRRPWGEDEESASASAARSNMGDDDKGEDTSTNARRAQSDVGASSSALLVPQSDALRALSLASASSSSPTGCGDSPKRRFGTGRGKWSKRGNRRGYHRSASAPFEGAAAGTSTRHVQTTPSSPSRKIAHRGLDALLSSVSPGSSSPTGTVGSSADQNTRIDAYLESSSHSRHAVGAGGSTTAISSSAVGPALSSNLNVIGEDDELLLLTNAADHGDANAAAGGGDPLVEDDDPVGDVLVRLLNDPKSRVGREFRYHECEGAAATAAAATGAAATAAREATGERRHDGNIDTCDNFHPILSSHNLKLFRDIMRRLLAFLSSTVFERENSVCKRGRSCIRKPTLRATLRSTTFFFAAATVLLAGPTAVVVLFSVRTTLLTLTLLATLLIDVDEIKSFALRVSPGWLVMFAAAGTRAAMSLAGGIWQLIDGYILLGREYAGRDGERTPAVGAITDRSRNTQDHLEALSFCSTMVAEAEIVRAQERSRRAESRRKKNKSQSPRRKGRRATVAGGGGVSVGTDASSIDIGGQRSRSMYNQAPRGRKGERLEGRMPDGDELLKRLLKDDDEEVHSDCFDSPLPYVLSNVSTVSEGNGADESIEIIETPTNRSDKHYSREFRSNPDLEVLLSVDGESRPHPWSSVGSVESNSDEYNFLSSGASVGSNGTGGGSETSSYLGGSLGSFSGRSPVASVAADLSPSIRSSKKERELNWFDVGTKVGIRLLNSEKVKKLMKDPAEAEKLFGRNSADLLQMDSASDTGALSPDRALVMSSSTRGTDVESHPGSAVSPKASVVEDIFNFSRSPVPSIAPTRPVHALWTSPEAVAMRREESLKSIGIASETDDNSIGVLSVGGGSSKASLNASLQDILAVDQDEEPPLSPLSSVASYSPKRMSRDNKAQARQCPSASFILPKPEVTTVEKCADVDDAIVARVDRMKATNSEGVSAAVQHSLRPKRKLSKKTSTPPCRRPTLLPGVKMVLPISPIQPHPGKRPKNHRHEAKPGGAYQMATIISSERIYVGDSLEDRRVCRTRSNDEVEADRDHETSDDTNCLSITSIVDKSYLRNGKFATITIRVMDEWRGAQYMPRHSKYPIGSCVATIFGVGVLVGWRVEDDMHVVQSLWQKRGAGSAMAYLNRNALSGVVTGGVGFKVMTTRGKGEVVAYTSGGRDFLRGTFAVKLKSRDGHATHVVKLMPNDIISCKAAKFMPVIELIKQAAQYQIQLEMYELALRQRYLLDNEIQPDNKEEAFWKVFEDGIEMTMSCFLKAIGEDQDFDEGMNEMLTSIIDFLEHLDFGPGRDGERNSSSEGREIDLDDSSSAIFAASTEEASLAEQEVSSVVTADECTVSDVAASPFWDMFGGMFKKKTDDASLARSDSLVSSASSTLQSDAVAIEKRTSKAYRKIFAFLKTTMRSVAIARASVPDQPNLQLGLSIVYEFLLFIRTIIKVQQANLSPDSVREWKATFRDFASIFGPMKERMAQICSKIAKRLERHGKKAKIRLLRFIDIILADEQFLLSLELLEWAKCIYRVELAVVKAKVVDAESCAQYHKAGVFLFETLAPRAQSQGDAAQRNEEKLARFAQLLKLVASPHRSLLKFLTRDDILDLIERLLVRVFQKDSEAARMLSIYAYNATSFRHIRMLKNMPVSGKLWGPLLDAAVEEFVSIVNALPDSGKVFIEPISKLFTLGVANFHKIRSGDINALTAHWLDFLAHEDAVETIQELDAKLRDSLDRFCKDVKEVMVVLPYYSTIDEDILQLIDEISIKQFLKEAADALVDADRFPFFLREKITFAVSRFLDYLPKMSIPIERREIGEGWVVTCRGKNGEDLRLSDVHVKQENLTCEVLGGDNILSPMFELKKQKSNAASLHSAPSNAVGCVDTDEEDEIERISVLNDIADLIRNAQLHGCWESGRGGVKESRKCIDPALKGLPVSEVLKCGVELWQNLEIDDDELMQLAIKDVTYQIQLQKDLEDGKVREMRDEYSLKSPSYIEECKSDVSSSSFCQGNTQSHWSAADSSDGEWRFNPRIDPTLLYLELLNMTFTLDEFLFRIEPAERSYFDPVFEGNSSLMIKNVSIKLRLECRKERMHQLDFEVFVPILQVETLEVALEKVKFKFKSTGADWLLNGLVKGARDIISDVVESKVKEQIVLQIEEGLANVNSYLASNPDLLLNVLGISIDDLEEHVVYL